MISNSKSINFLQEIKNKESSAKKATTSDDLGLKSSKSGALFPKNTGINSRVNKILKKIEFSINKDTITHWGQVKPLNLLPTTLNAVNYDTRISCSNSQLDILTT